VTRLIVRQLGLVDYPGALQAMQQFTDQRDKTTLDEFWLLQHPAVFTQGQAGKEEHLLNPGDIPVIQSDRGGQVTYHGPGQLVCYLLIDLKRHKLGVRELVTLIETSLIQLLKTYGIESQARSDAPGVYVQSGNTAVDGAKIAQLGLRIRRGASFHGLSLNVDLDLEPFQRINPCGLTIAVTSMQQLLDTPPSMDDIAVQLVNQLVADLGYTEVEKLSSKIADL
jgi:lipoyl(octanoyl) transferase